MQLILREIIIANNLFDLTSEALRNRKLYKFSKPVFPGAEGFGSITVAGRGGIIYRVDTLDEDEPAVIKADGTYHGSLRAACEASGPRIIVFETSGTIILTSNIVIDDPYYTVAGQTAPSPGITLRGGGITILTNDVLIQHLRIRVGDDEVGPDPLIRDCIQVLTSSAYNVVVDHISGSWAVDEDGSTWSSHDVTVSNSIFSEALCSSLHPKGPHSMAFLIGDGTKNLTFKGNLLSTARERFPLVKGDTTALISNNVMYNCGSSVFSVIGGSDSIAPAKVSYAGNVFIPGLEYTDPGAIHVLGTTVNENTEVYLSDNLTYGSTLFSYATQNDPRVTTPPIWWNGLTVKASGDVEDWVLANAGARPADRDSVDICVVNDVINGTGKRYVGIDRNV